MTRTRLAATRRAIRLVLAVVVMLPAVVAWAPVAAAQDPVIAAAGDIACAPSDPVTPDTCHQQATSDLLVGAPLAAVLPLGDIQYDSASLSDFLGVLRPHLGAGQVDQPSGRRQPRVQTGNAGYFDYFNGAGVADGPRGRRGKG